MTVIGNWTLNGTALTMSGTAQSKPTNASSTREIRHALDDIHGQTQRREKVGINLATKKFTFSLLSSGRAKFDQAAFIQGLIDNEEEITIKAPDGYYVVPGFQSAQFAVKSNGLEESGDSSVGKITLSLDAFHLGSLIRDGGVYAPTQAWRNDFITNGYFATDAASGFVGVPLLGAPAQQFGYPVGIKASTMAQDVLPVKWTLTAIGDDGVTATVNVYDTTGFWFGEPLSSGTGGPGQFTFSPAVV